VAPSRRSNPGLETTTVETDSLNLPDDLLVARAKRHSPDFVLLYRRYVEAVYRYCALRLDSREAAEDATSLVFTRAFTGLMSCRDDHFRSWLFAIAHNIVADSYRRQRPLWPLLAAESLPDPTPSPEDTAVDADEHRWLRALLTELAPDQRHVVELRLAGLTDAEIARVLGRSHGAVRSIQFRAVARLRALLGANRDAVTRLSPSSPVNKEQHHAGT